MFILLLGEEGTGNEKLSGTGKRDRSEQAKRGRKGGLGRLRETFANLNEKFSEPREGRRVDKRI